jgi:acyl-CoA synthetase (AMP-forming)/AMP-acid ligase II
LIVREGNALYQRWLETARHFSNELAVLDTVSGRQWTFKKLAEAVEQFPSASGKIVFPSGHNPEFVIQTLAAWRDGKITCPIEPGQARPDFSALPGGVAHVKLTSATTGSAKSILFSASQLAADARNIVSTMGLRPEWPNLTVISMAHSYGFSNLILPLALHGTPLVIASAPLPQILLNAASAVPNITLPAVPALWKTWLQSKAIPPNTRLAISAGAPLSTEIEQEAFCKHGLKIHNFYGSSECGGIAYDRLDHPRTEENYVGTAMDNVRLSLNELGTLEVQGDAVATSYWPESTEALGQGRFVTQDLAQLQGDSVRLLGRLSDVINVAGRKVAPETVERFLRANSSVHECVVFGIPSPESRGETIVACINGPAQTAALIQALSKQLPAWQIPRLWWFTPDLKANARGKISRPEWRQKYLAKHGSTAGVL